MTPGNAFRRLIAEDRAHIAPGIYDSLSARLAADAGFEIGFASGGSIVRSFGLPDLGLADPTMMAERFAQIVEAAGIPILADADNGFGNELNVTRVVRLYERAGVAAMHIEDQVFPKRCGFYTGIELIAATEMADKIKAAVDARRDASTLIVARTDACKDFGLAEAIDRAALYAEAGAEMLFIEGIWSESALQDVGKALPQPKVLNCGPPGAALPLSREELAKLGFKLLIYPADLQCAALSAMADCLDKLKSGQGPAFPPPSPGSLEARDRLVRIESWLSLGKDKP
jgi:2-methylisocitrate lyase-like PEP mutase family enzyme